MRELYLLVLFVPASVLVQAVQQPGYYQHQQPQYNAVPVPTYRNQQALQGYSVHQDIPSNHRQSVYVHPSQHAHLASQAREAFASVPRKPQQAYHRPIPPVPVHVQPSTAAAAQPRQVSVPQYSEISFQVIAPQTQQYRPQPQPQHHQHQQYQQQHQPQHQPQHQQYSQQVQPQYRVSQAPQYSVHQHRHKQDDEEEKYVSTNFFQNQHNLQTPPNPYQFGFDVQDDHNTNYQNRKEHSDGKKITGSYSVVDSDGFLRTVQYTADPKEGFKAEVIRQPTDIVVKTPKPQPQFQLPQKYVHQDPQQYLQEVPVQREDHQQQHHQQQQQYQYQ
nr:unnamed protein product [Callosobruchus chinensis]